MDKFIEGLKVKKEDLEYQEYLRKRFAKEVQKEKWKNAKKRMEEKER